MSEKHVNHQEGPMACPVGLGDVDLFAAGAPEHWYEAYEILHNEAPVLRIAGGGLTAGTDAFVLTRHADVVRVVRDPQRFASITQQRVGGYADRGLSADETYTTYRNLMQAAMVTLRPTQELYISHRKELTDPWVGTGATRHREMIARHAQELLDEWFGSSAATRVDETETGDVTGAGQNIGAEAGAFGSRGDEPRDARVKADGAHDRYVEGDFVARFARPLPQRVMASILGFPQADIPRLAAWGDAVVMPFVHGTGLKHELTSDQTADMLRRLDGFQDYIYDHVRAKRRDPHDDMVSFLCSVEYAAIGRRLTDLEIAGIVHAMIIGGLETTQYALAEQAQLLCEHPMVFERLRADRSNVRGFVEESLRLRSPTHGLSTRLTTRDEKFDGIDIPAGSLLHLRFGAANVDPDEFDSPMELDIDRAAITRHVAFSAGPRVCPGANLSRVEQQVAWGVLLDSVAAIDYAAGNNWRHQPGIMLGTTRVNVRLHRPA